MRLALRYRLRPLVQPYQEKYRGSLETSHLTSRPFENNNSSKPSLNCILSFITAI